MSETVNNDELAVFVTSTLNAILVGVESASSKSRKFNPPGYIDFEVAVKAAKSSEAGGGLRIQVFSLDGKKSVTDEAGSKISFRVTTSGPSGSNRSDDGNWKTV